MNWKASPPAVEIVAAAVSVASLGGATCFAVLRVAPLGAGWIEAVITGVCAALAGGWMIARIDRQPRASAYRPPVETTENVLSSDDVLLLEDRVEADDFVAIDDAEPRVVRLFAAPTADPEEAPPLTGPGEMIARIEDFLGQSRGGAAAWPMAPERTAPQQDANAALHAALADIRRSLRQG